MFRSKSPIFVTFVVGILAYLVYEFNFKIEYSPVLEISSGYLRGFVSKSRLLRNFYQYRGIPYGKASRFESPRAVEPWSGVRNAVSFGSKCTQVEALSRKITGAEDCLFLNVYVPKDALARKPLLPVIFYIHGGYFMTGSSDLFLPEYLMDEDVILVTLNYRLNVFGFLNTGDGTVRGNMGLKDQNLALRWTKDNIKKFGGNPDRVTIAGQSAGSAAVHFHLLSKMSKGLFSAAIMSSGTAIKPWSLALNPKEQAVYLAKLLNCSTASVSEMVNCLRTVEAVDIVKAQIHAIDSPLMNPLEIFAPSVEVSKPGDTDVFLSEHPYSLLKSGNGSNLPILTGVNSEEGLLASGRIWSNATLMSIIENSWDELSPNLLFYNKNLGDLTTKIRKFYVGSSKPIQFKEKFKSITNALSDRLYIHPTRETVRIQSRLSPVYLYYFNYRLKRGLTYLYDVDPTWPLVPQFIYKEIKWFIDEYILKRDHLFLGVIHGDDIALIFKFPVIHLSPGTKDFEQSRQMVKMWVEFAKDPYKMEFNGTQWPPVNPKDVQPYKFMFISSEEGHGSMIDEPFSDRMQFWDEMNLPWEEAPRF